MTPYSDVASAQIYFDEKLNTEAWDIASSSEKLKALKYATRLINNLKFKGQKADISQENEFPRYGQSSVPEAIREACNELALELLDGADPNLEMKAVTQTSHGYSAARTTFNREFVLPYLAHGIVSSEAWSRLLPYLADPLRIKMKRR